MHISLDSVLGQQRRLNQVGESITQIAPDPSAAYSLRSLTGSDPRVVRVRRESDNDERDFTASEVSSGALTSYVNAQVTAPLDIQELEADGRTGDFLIAKAAYSLRSLGTRQATVTSSGDTAGDTSGKYVCQVRRNVNGDVKSFTATEVSDGTLLSFVNESFTSSLPLDVAGSAAAAYGLRNLSSSYTGNVVEVRRASESPFSDSSTRNFTAAEVTDGTLVSFVTEPIPKTLSVQPLGEDSTWDVTVVDNSNYTIDCNNNTSTKFCRLFPVNLNGGTKYRTEFTLTTNSGDASNLKLNRVNPFTQRNVVEGFNSIDLDFTNDTILQWRVSSGNSFNATISNLTVTAIGNDGHVKTWYDQSGNSKNATQTTAANQPKIVSSGALVTNGGKPALRFDGTSHRLELSAKATIANTSIFSAFRSNSNAQDSVLFHLAVNGSNAVSIGLGDLATSSELGSRLRVGGSNLVSVGDNTFSSTSQSLLSYIASSSAAKMFVDSTQETDGVASRTSGANNRIGARGDDDKFFNGDIGEVILYDTDQTDKRRAIEESIATANGITLASFNRDGFVRTWYDQSVDGQTSPTANNNHATQTTADNQPKIVSAGALETDSSGNPALVGDGTDDNLLNSTLTNQLDSSDFLVTAAYKDQLAMGITGAEPRLYLTSSQMAYNTLNTISYSTQTGRKILSFQVVGDTQEVFANGSSIGTASQAQVDIGQSLFGVMRGGSSFSSGPLMEVLVYNSNQSANRTAIEANIGEHYSISGIPAFDNSVNGFVEAWYDQSGNGTDATMTTISLQPKIVDNGVIETDRDGKVALNGLGAKLDLPAGAAMLSSDGTFSLFAVVDLGDQRTGSVTFNNIFIFDASSTGGASSTRKPQIYIKQADGRLVSSTPSFTAGTVSISVSNVTSMQLLTNIANPALSTGNNLLYADGALQGSSNNNTDVNTTTTLDSSGVSIFQPTESSVTHFLSEVIYYPSDQSANRPAIEANIANQYGITLS